MRRRKKRTKRKKRKLSGKAKRSFARKHPRIKSGPRKGQFKRRRR